MVRSESTWTPLRSRMRDANKEKDDGSRDEKEAETSSCGSQVDGPDASVRDADKEKDGDGDCWLDTMTQCFRWNSGEYPKGGGVLR